MKNEIDKLLSYKLSFWRNNNELDKYLKQIDELLKLNSEYRKYELVELKIFLLHILNRQDQALSFALSELKNTNIKNAGIIKIYIKIGNIYLIKNQFDAALSFFSKAKKMSKELKMENYYIQSLMNEANIYINTGQLKKARDLYLNSLKLSTKDNYEKLKAISYSNLGLIYMQVNKLGDALSNYLKALQIYDKLKDEKQIYVVLANISVLYLYLGDFKKAIDYSQKAIEIGKKLKEWEKISQLYNNLGSIYIRTGNFKEAEKYLINSIKLKKKIGDKLGLAKTLSNMARIKYENKNYKETEKYFKRALKIQKELNDNMGELYTLMNLTDFYLEMQKYKKALSALKELDNMKIENNPKIEEAIYQLYLKYYQKKRNYKKALDYYKKFEKIYTKNFILTNNRKLNKLITKYEAEKAEKEKRIQYLKNVELKNANATKDKFFSIIAHDLKTPFSSIIFFISLMKTNYEKLSNEKIYTLINELSKTVKNTYLFLENLLNWAKMQTDSIKYNPQNLNVANVINEVFSTLRSRANQKKISLINKVDFNIFVYADPFMLEAVIRNLVNNALKFTYPNGKITVFAKQKDDNIVISVKDTGVGMSEDTLSKLFKLETTFSTYGTENEKGTGLGLIICKEFVEKNKGKISVKSKPGEGSTFFIELPGVL